MGHPSNATRKPWCDGALVLRLTVILSALLVAGTARLEGDPERDRRRSPVVEVFEKSRDAVVNINTTRIVRMRSLRSRSLWDDIFDFGPSRLQQRKVHNIGSGVVLHESGYIVTNAHVISQASDVRVSFADGHTEPAEILEVDGDHDLAILKIKTNRPLTSLKLGRSGDIMVGETVVAIGNPLGLQHTVTAGIVSALGRDLIFSNDVAYRGLIQTDASINPGNSGGPLLNTNGELIGINTAIRGDAQNIGFAIPVDRLWELLPGMLDIERRRRVRFGLRVDGPHAEISAVRPDSPAAKTNLQPGDRILRFNGRPIRNGIDYYVHLLERQAGDKITLTVQRDDTTVTAEVPLQAIPLPDGRQLAWRLLGIELETIPERIRRRYDLPSHIGLVVARVAPGSPADQAGVRATDLILRLGGMTTATIQDVGLALERLEPAARIVTDGYRLSTDPMFFWTVSIRTRR